MIGDPLLGNGLVKPMVIYFIEYLLIGFIISFWVTVFFITANSLFELQVTNFLLYNTYKVQQASTTAALFPHKS